MLSTSSPLLQYVTQQWDGFSEFAIYLNRTASKNNENLWFDGEGFFGLSYENSKESHYLFSINNTMYSSVILDDGKTQFQGVLELDNDFFQSSLFKKKSGDYFNNLDASVTVDVKPYDYGNEHKLLISKFSKVELFFTQQLSYHEDGSCSIATQSYSQLEQAVAWQVKVNEIDARTAQLLAAKKKDN